MNDDLQKQLTVLFADHTKNLTKRIINIEQLWHELQKKWDVALIKKLYEEIHNLYAAGTYGYHQLSHIAKCLDEILLPLLTGIQPTQNQLEQIQKLIIELKKAGQPSSQDLSILDSLKEKMDKK